MDISVINYDDKTIYQHNMITQARFDMSVYELNVFFLLLSKLDKVEKIGKLYRISIQEIEAGIGKSININQLKQATSSLRSREYCMTRQDGSYFQVGLIASAEYIKGEGVIELELSRKMAPYLFELKDNFTAYQLKTALKLNSKYSKRLYQILSQYKSSGRYVTSIAKLREQLNMVGKTGEEKYTSDFGMFRKKVLEVAQNELANTDIQFTYKPIKDGRKFISLDFCIQYKPIAPSAEGLEAPPLEAEEADNLYQGEAILWHPEEDRALPDNRRPLYLRMKEQFSLNHKQIAIIFEHFPIKTIRKKLIAVEPLLKTGEISNVGAYTASQFELTKNEISPKTTYKGGKL